MTLVISGWREGLDKVGLNVLLREYAGLSLGAAKRAVDDLLDNKPVTVEILDSSEASEFSRRAASLGCCRVTESQPVG